ncbi:unnamed protein product [Boreogadus saida]
MGSLLPGLLTLDLVEEEELHPGEQQSVKGRQLVRTDASQLRPSARGRPPAAAQGQRALLGPARARRPSDLQDLQISTRSAGESPLKLSGGVRVESGGAPGGGQGELRVEVQMRSGWRSGGGAARASSSQKMQSEAPGRSWRR